MRKTKNIETDYKVAVDIDELSAMLSCGRTTARKIGVAAGARVQVGRRVLYSVKKVENYIETVADELI